MYSSPLTVVMTEQKEQHGVTRYNVICRVRVLSGPAPLMVLTLCAQPIPLDLLTLINFTEPPTQREAGLFRGLWAACMTLLGAGDSGRDSAPHARSAYPFMLHHNGRAGGVYRLYAESPTARVEWKQKLDAALGLHRVRQEKNRVFKPEILSTETFIVPVGNITCTVPFGAYAPAPARAAR
jgi:hypothetical protein